MAGQHSASSWSSGGGAGQLGRWRGRRGPPAPTAQSTRWSTPPPPPPSAHIHNIKQEVVKTMRDIFLQKKHVIIIREC